MTAFLRIDVEPPESVEATAAAIAQRLNLVSSSTAFEPTANGTFTHGTTAVESTIASSAVFPTITSTLVTSDLGQACANLQNLVISAFKLVNRVVYTLEANGMTS